VPCASPLVAVRIAPCGLANPMNHGRCFGTRWELTGGPFALAPGVEQPEGVGSWGGQGTWPVGPAFRSASSWCGSAQACRSGPVPGALVLRWQSCQRFKGVTVNLQSASRSRPEVWLRTVKGSPQPKQDGQRGFVPLKAVCSGGPSFEAVVWRLLPSAVPLKSLIPPPCTHLPVMLSMLKYVMLFRYISLYQKARIARSWHAEQLSPGTASADPPGQVDVATAEPTGTGHPREHSPVPLAEARQKR